MGYARQALPSDAVAIIPSLREADRMEIRAAFGTSPEAVLLPPIFAGRANTMVSDNGDLLGFFGVDRTVDPMVGQIWMVASTAIERHQIEFLRAAKVAVKELHRDYPVLGNFVDARNTVHIKWLRWMGFSFINSFEEWGFEKRPFLQFARIDT